MPVRIEINTQGLDSLVRNIKGIKGKKIVVGFVGRKGSRRYSRRQRFRRSQVRERRSRSPGPGPTVATVAMFQEFGVPKSSRSPGLPARPFMRRTANKTGAIAKIFAKHYRNLIFLGTPARTMLQASGKDLEKLMGKEMDRSFSWAVPNSPVTVKLKGFNYPLHDTTLMRSSVGFAVRKGKVR